MAYRLIALDLDGTLTNSQKELSPRTFSALQRAQEQGVTVVLASGRPTYGIAPLADQLGLDQRGGYVLSFNGGRIVDWRTKEVIFEQVLDPALHQRVYAFAQREGLPIVTYTKGEILCNSEPDHYIALEAGINHLPVRHAPDFLATVAALPHGVPKFLMGGDPERLVPLEEEMKAALGAEMEICRSAPFFLELMPRGVDKALSLERLLAHLGLSREESIACGDGGNDLTMIRFAGLGVAMANAEDYVRNEADHITLSNDEDGVAEVLEHFVLK